METFFALLAICVCVCVWAGGGGGGGFTGQRWIARTKASDAEHWCFLSSVLELTIYREAGGWIETPSRPLWRHCNDTFAVGFCMHEYENDIFPEIYKYMHMKVIDVHQRGTHKTTTNQVYFLIHGTVRGQISF